MVTVIVVALICVVVLAYKKRSAAATKLYFGFVLLSPVLSLIAGAHALSMGRSFLEGYAAAMLVAGTVAQILVELSGRGGKKFIAAKDSREALKASGWGIIFVAALAGLLNVLFAQG
ncbi:hypothetical protein [Microbacterium sp. NPDC090003]|uniref:hypothetical protein n=1 Tax=Microbacterium sp. NPDC090003 TaxID=3364203 RepID=UPI0038283526